MEIAVASVEPSTTALTTHLPPADLASLLDSLYQSSNDASHTSIQLLHEQLTSIKDQLVTHPPLLSSFLSHHYAPLCHFLLTRFAVDWLAAFTPSQRGASFDFFFSSPIPASHVLLAITSALRSPPPASVSARTSITSTVLSLLTAFLHTARVVDLLNELAPSITSSTSASILSPRGQQCVDALVSLPSLLSNRLERDTPSSFTPSTYYTVLLQQSQPLLSSPSPRIAPLSTLFSKLTRIGHASLIMQTVLPPFLTSLPGADEDEEVEEWMKRARQSVVTLSDLLLCLNPLALGGFMQSLLVELTRLGCRFGQRQVDFALYGVVAASFHSSSPSAVLVRNLLMNKLIVSRPLDPPACSLILTVLFHLSFPSLSSTAPSHPLYPFFDQTLTSLTRLWSSSSFLHHAPPAVQSSVTASVLASLRLLSSHQHLILLQSSAGYREWVGKRGEREEGDGGEVMGLYGGHDCMVSVMEGVQLRMGELSEERRKEGMKIAVEMSKLMDPTRPLTFDVEDEEDASEHERPPVQPTPTPQPPLPTHAIPQHVELDPDAEWTPDTQLSSAWSTDTAVTSPAPSIPPLVYDLTEHDADLRKVPVPHYLRDVLDYLRKQDERDHIEAALEEVTSLIRSRPFDLPDLASDLCAALQQVATTVFCEDRRLDGLRREGLVSLVVACPTVTVVRLISSLDGNSLTLHGKLEVLEVMVKGTEELSGKKLQTTEDKSPAGLKASIVPHNNDQRAVKDAGGREGALLTREQHTQVIAQRVEARTRRWGRAQRPPADTFINQFAPIAHLFFFPLLNRVDVNGGWGAQSIVDSDPLLLSSLLHTLSIFVALASPSSPTLHSLTSNLLHLLLITRHHRHPLIRQRTMLALLRVVLIVPTVVMEGVTGELKEMREWVMGIEGDEGVGDEGRMMARLCRGEMDGRFSGLKGWWDGGGRREEGEALQLVIPNTATLTTPSSVSTSSMIKFM